MQPTNSAWTKSIEHIDEDDNLGDDDNAADGDDDMFLHHYIVDKVSRVQKTGLSLHNTMLGPKLFVQFVQIYPHHDSPFCSVYANLSITHFCTYDAVFFCVNVQLEFAKKQFLAIFHANPQQQKNMSANRPIWKGEALPIPHFEADVPIF